MTTTYKDDDLVYVDPDTRKVVSLVDFTETGEPKQREMIKVAPKPKEAGKEEKEGKKPMRKRPMRKRFYPWGTYKTMKKIYRIEGKEKASETYKTLDQAISLAVEQPFWDE